MNYAEPAPTTEPAVAEKVTSTNLDNEYKVEPAPAASDGYNVETYKVGPAVLYDPKKFAPHKQLNEPYRYVYPNNNDSSWQVS
jgi:hypothetical protein